MRKGYSGLQSLVETAMGHNVLDGHLFLFVARNQRRAKVLVWDGTGLAIYMKRLERGRFIAPWKRESSTMTVSELALFLEGSVAVKGPALSPTPFLPRQIRSKGMDGSYPMM